MELYNDDCFNVFPKIDKKIDLVVVDLPYGQTAAEWDELIDLEKMWKELKRICKDNCIYVFFCTTKFGFSLIDSNQKWFRYDIVWDKAIPVGFLNCNKQPLRQHEMIYIFYNKQGVFNPQKTPGKPYYNSTIPINNLYGNIPQKTPTNNDTGDRFPLSILKCPKPRGKDFHPTHKPLDLLERLIKTYSNEGDKVLDFTMGGGSTGLACKNTNRYFIGIEKNEDFYKMCCKKLEYDE
jgi:site-specific DNA-methyltransferase (adenine-specific)